ncbi:MAG: lipoate--protein ligase family protein [Candidatus Omnitrophica bacterium]|nr:lipoate--protein ligase family protein [Candidatus Omnitrophota bacterium]
MIIKDVSLDTPEDNLLYDEALLLLAERNNTEDILRFWEFSGPFVVLGKVSDEGKDVFINACAEDKIPVLRRSSGGGTVILGKGCLNYSLILSKKRNPYLNNITRSYHEILGKLIESFIKGGIGCGFFPTCDIVLLDGYKKFSGNAQKRGRDFVLHHGTVLYDFDLSLISKYLMIPEDQPQYRNNRKHEDFVANISLPIWQIKEIFISAFGAKEFSDITEQELSYLDYLKRVKAEKELAFSESSFA